MNSQFLTRREMMKASAASLIAAGIWPGALRAQDATAPDFDFICCNDLHYIDPTDLPFLESAVKKMKEASPNAKLALVVGDLCEKGTPAELDGMKAILKALNLPYHVVIGNHDWTTQTDRKAYEERYPNSINYTFEQNGWQFVGLDSSQGVDWQNTAIQKPTLDWLDQNLPKLDKRRPMIVFTHFPLGQGVRYQVTNSAVFLDRFKEFNVRAIFNGHFHGYTEQKQGDWLITTNRCCARQRDNHDGTKDKGFFACKTRDGKVLREFIRVV